jgi:hypothetical protein
MIKRGSWVIVGATPGGSRRSFPGANWIHEEDGNFSLVKLLEDAPFQSTLDVLDVELVDGTQEGIYDFNILGVVSRYRSWEKK